MSSAIPAASPKRTKSAIEASTMRSARETTQVRRRNRASEGVASLRGGVEAQPLASLAMAFLVGLALGTLLASSAGSNRR